MQTVSELQSAAGSALTTGRHAVKFDAAHTGVVQNPNPNPSPALTSTQPEPNQCAGATTPIITACMASRYPILPRIAPEAPTSASMLTPVESGCRRWSAAAASAPSESTSGESAAVADAPPAAEAAAGRITLAGLVAGAGTAPGKSAASAVDESIAATPEHTQSGWQPCLCCSIHRSADHPRSCRVARDMNHRHRS
jgi:hypothetical protein